MEREDVIQTAFVCYVSWRGVMDPNHVPIYIICAVENDREHDDLMYMGLWGIRSHD